MINFRGIYNIMHRNGHFLISYNDLEYNFVVFYYIIQEVNMLLSF